jgi:isoleucyl-tRNA synthetase
MKSYKPVSNRPDFNQLEKEIISFWQKNKVFKKSVEIRKDAEEFIFFEGPPTANGKPGVHHVLARTFKDLVCRFQTMNGKKVERRAGWDEHGLPVEIEVQKKNDLKSKEDILALGLDKFNSLCAESTQQYIDEWQELTARMGYWVDFETAYRTSDPKYIESVWGILKKLHEKNLLYKGSKVVPWACDSGTVVSQAEVALGYKDVVDESAYVKFEASDEAVKTISDVLKGLAKLEKDAKVYLLAWTTTPWTLPSNMALAIGPEIEYSFCKSLNTDSHEYLIISKKRKDKVLSSDEYTEVAVLKGIEILKGLKYKNLFGSERLGVIIPGKKVDGSIFVEDSEDSGTGIVHIAPAFGQDDLEAYFANNLEEEILCAVNPDGLFNDLAPSLVNGQSIFNENKKTQSLEFVRINKIINKFLDEKGLLLKTEKYEHSYPHNWRTDNPLIYYLRPSWYVRTKGIKNDLVEINEKAINWYPEHIKEGRFGQWLANNVDWSISRERFWGTPIPVWVGENTGAIQVLGSYQELLQKLENGNTKLYKKLKKQIEDGKFDPHKPNIDEVSWEEGGEKFVRIPEVLDCWFDSGSMPVASFNSEPEKFKTADFICEAVDQTRGWFYSLLAIAACLDKRTSYKNVLCLGHILDKDGQKMSKSKGNVINPWELFEKFGADPVRWYMVSAVSAGQPIRFNIEAINEVMRRFLLPLWNTYSFYVLYANLDKVNTDDLYNQPNELLERLQQPIDLWILAKLAQTQKTVSEELSQYEFSKAAQEVEKFVDELSNIWVRGNRSRFWNTKSEHGVDYNAYITLHTCLVGVCKLIAPFMPMIADAIFANLKHSSEPNSIHLTDWEEVADLSPLEQNLIEDMLKAQEIINVGRSLRQEQKVKIRQPLAQIWVNKELMLKYFNDLVLSELNIKEIVYKEQPEKVLLNTYLSEELISEGTAREVIHTIQNLRKSSGLDVADRIKLHLKAEDVKLTERIASQKDYIMSEVLATTFEIGSLNGSSDIKTAKLDGKEFQVSIKKHD